MFQWGTQTEEEARKQTELKEGIHKFKVKKAELKAGKNDSTFMSLNLTVYLPDGQVFVDDVFFDNKSTYFKRKKFWESVGHPEMINATGPEFLDREGFADFKLEEYYSTKYGENRQKLVVKEYVVLSDESNDSPFVDDDIPDFS